MDREDLGCAQEREREREIEREREREERERERERERKEKEVGPRYAKWQSAASVTLGTAGAPAQRDTAARGRGERRAGETGACQ